MSDECDAYIRRAMVLADDLLALASEGDEVRKDVGCGVLFGTMRDCAYKIRALAESELLEHTTGKTIAKK